MLDQDTDYIDSVLNSCHLGKQQKRAPPLVVRPLRPSLPPPPLSSSLMGIGTFFLVFRANVKFYFLHFVCMGVPGGPKTQKKIAASLTVTGSH